MQHYRNKNGYELSINVSHDFCLFPSFNVDRPLLVVESPLWKSIQIDRKTTETWKCLIDLLKEFQPQVKGPFSGLVHFTHLPPVPACHIHDIHSVTGSYINSLILYKL